MKLTLLIVQNAELPLHYLRYNLDALERWNYLGLEDTQIIVLSQLKNSDNLRMLCDSYPFKVEVVETQQEFVGDYPVWDLMSQMRKIWHLVKGEYFTVQHPEFVWLPFRLSNTISWLDKHKPYMALGNLRRPAIPGIHIKDSEPVSKTLTDMMDVGNWAKAAAWSEMMPTIYWVYWRTPPPFGKTEWYEDVFFARTDWFEAMKWFSHGGQLPFQDVYDLMGKTCGILTKFKIMPQIYRMDLETSQQIHLYHKKQWGCWTHAMRARFLQDFKWKNTPFANEEIWNSLIKHRDIAKTDDNNVSYQAVVNLRYGLNGTVSRFVVAFKNWLGKGNGYKQLMDFYAH